MMLSAPSVYCISMSHARKVIYELLAAKVIRRVTVPCRVNPEKLTCVQQKLEAFLAQEKEQKERAQRVSTSPTLPLIDLSLICLITLQLWPGC